jgi:hypothetical protein
MRNIAVAACLALAVSSAALAAVAQPPTMLRAPFVDEASKDASFVEFRRSLTDIVRREDGEALMKLIAPDCVNIIGSPPGPDRFRSEWKPEKPKSDVWAPLLLLLAEGGTFSDPNTFRAPYVFWTKAPQPLPTGWDDEVVAVTDANAAMRAEPKRNAQIVRQLDHDLLNPFAESYMGLQSAAGPDDWVHVVDAAGTTGFVRARDVRSLVWDFRAEFTKRDGRWWITLLQFSD